jgi:hypothetical protein
MPTFVQDDGPFRFSAELFIVFRSTPGDKTCCTTIHRPRLQVIEERRKD